MPAPLAHPRSSAPAVPAWVLLAGAVVSEVVGSLSLRAALDHPAWYALVVAGYLSAFVLLGAVLRAGVPLGVAYGVWGALGVTLTALGGAALFAEALTPTTILGMVLVVAGVLLVEGGHGAGAEAATESGSDRR